MTELRPTLCLSMSMCAVATGMRVRLAIARINAEKDGTEIVGPKFVPVED